VEKDVFARRFEIATSRARDLAREMIEEALPDEMLWVWLPWNAEFRGAAQRHLVRGLSLSLTARVPHDACILHCPLEGQVAVQDRGSRVFLRRAVVSGA
jgi:hypothetical protein